MKLLYTRIDMAAKEILVGSLSDLEPLRDWAAVLRQRPGRNVGTAPIAYENIDPQRNNINPPQPLAGFHRESEEECSETRALWTYQCAYVHDLSSVKTWQTSVRNENTGMASHLMLTH